MVYFSNNLNIYAKVSKSDIWLKGKLSFPWEWQKCRHTYLKKNTIHIPHTTFFWRTFETPYTIIFYCMITIHGHVSPFTTPRVGACDLYLKAFLAGNRECSFPLLRKESKSKFMYIPRCGFGQLFKFSTHWDRAGVALSRCPVTTSSIRNLLRKIFIRQP